MASLLLGLLLAGGPAAATPWTWDLAAGFDSYVQSYALAETDTTETLTESLVEAGLSGASAFGARHRWRVRADAGTGSELTRQHLFGEYRFMGAGRIERFRVAAEGWGRQYRGDTDYTLRSDLLEGRSEVRVTPWVADGFRLEARGSLAALDYASPTTLELDRRDSRVGVHLRSLPAAPALWSIGARLGSRTYPDSAAIDRDTWRVAGEFELPDTGDGGVRLLHLSDSRQVRDETVRPSGRTHWTEIVVQLPAGEGRFVGDIQVEAWRYDRETDVYFDNTRIEVAGSYRWGDPLRVGWSLGPAGEWLEAGGSPETYIQYGLRGGVESYGLDLSGSLTVEYGRRTYAGDTATATLTDGIDLTDLYSDFSYWKLWLMGTWRLAPTVDVDLMASYEPESHTEQADDVTLGFASLRLRWRP